MSAVILIGTAAIFAGILLAHEYGARYLRLRSREAAAWERVADALERLERRAER